MHPPGCEVDGQGQYEDGGDQRGEDEPSVGRALLGGELHDAKVKLRHSTITLTSDTYMELFEKWEDELAEKTAAAVPRARRASSGESGHAPVTHEAEGAAETEEV